MKFNTNHWYYNLIIGLLFIIISFYLLIYPMVHIQIANIIFCLLFIMSGSFQFMIGMYKLNDDNGRGWDIISGILTTTLGTYLLFNLSVEIEVLTLLISFFIIYKGIEQIVAAVNIHSSKEGWTISSGVLSIVLGFILLYHPKLSPYLTELFLSLGLLNAGWMEISIASKLFKRFKLNKKVNEQ